MDPTDGKPSHGRQAFDSKSMTSKWRADNKVAVFGTGGCFVLGLRILLRPEVRASFHIGTTSPLTEIVYCVMKREGDRATTQRTSTYLGLEHNRQMMNVNNQPTRRPLSSASTAAADGKTEGRDGRNRPKKQLEACALAVQWVGG